MALEVRGEMVYRHGNAVLRLYLSGDRNYKRGTCDHQRLTKSSVIFITALMPASSGAIHRFSERTFLTYQHNVRLPLRTYQSQNMKGKISKAYLISLGVNPFVEDNVEMR